MYPGSEPESRAVIEQAAHTPNLFAWLNLHTFGGCMIRPPGDVPDAKMNQQDLALYRQVEEWCGEICGYPMVSGYEEFLYQPEKPVRGTLSEWAYVERGCLAWVTELWDIFARIAMERPKRFVDHYTRMTRKDIEALARWDREHNAGRIFKAFAPATHPQLGEVEVGGLDPRVGLSNPSYEELPKVCEQHARLFLRVAAMAPRVVVSRVRTERLGDAVTLLEADIDNQGYLATHGVHAAEDKPWNEPLWGDLGCEGDLALVDPSQAHRLIGHLAGWGRGFGHSIFFQRSRGSASHRRTLSWMLRGRGVAHIAVGSCRIGRVEHDVAIE
jgi:hypothetical protein